MKQRSENPFEPRLGRIRSGGRLGRGRTLMSKIARSVSRAGSASARRRGVAQGYAKRSYSRRVIVKARFVRSAMASPKALAQHLRYISRDDATREEDHDRVFGSISDDVDRAEFADAAKNDRHHFRFIISPEDGTEMADLKPFVRDLAMSMERDLGTRLEWVAAVHDNTEHPHAHMLIRGRRDDGRDLVMPRAYISHGVRERAEELVTLELGPQSQLEKETKLARQTTAERLTEIDRTFAALSDENGEYNLMLAPSRYRSINAARLSKLSSIGLAVQTGANTWQLAEGFQSTLKSLGERGDIIKQINHSLRNKPDRVIAPHGQVMDEKTNPITGAVLRIGMMGEGHDEPCIIVDGLDGQVTIHRVDHRSIPADLRRGMIVSMVPTDFGPKPSDATIDQIARANAGAYSIELHQTHDPGSSPEFIGAHIRRLEALRRNGLVERGANGTWQIPTDYLQRVTLRQGFIARKVDARPEVRSWANLDDQIKARGLTWLDQDPQAQKLREGFGEEVRRAQHARKVELMRRGSLTSIDKELDSKARSALEREGMNAIGQQLVEAFGKRYAPMPNKGAIEGVFRQSILRPEGKFAVIEQQRSFTLVPWRNVMDRARGQMISGTVGGRNISWNFGRSKGRSFSC